MVETALPFSYCVPLMEWLFQEGPRLCDGAAAATLASHVVSSPTSSSNVSLIQLFDVFAQCAEGCACYLIFVTTVQRLCFGRTPFPRRCAKLSQPVGTSY